MFSEPLVAQLAAELQQAELSRVQVEHFSRRYPGMTIEDGYQVARAWVQLKLAAGRTARGHKIGLTSRAMQQASQITEPDYGTLLDDMFIAEGSEIPAARFIAPPPGWPGWPNKLAPWGEFLDQGEIVLSGSFTRPVNAVAGDTFHADYGPLGSIAFRFT